MYLTYTHITLLTEPRFIFIINISTLSHLGFVFNQNYCISNIFSDKRERARDTNRKSDPSIH